MMGDYHIKAHPTRYVDILFRSRLEASYAAFFDLLGWQWEYEPLDLNGWTPDFRIVIPCSHSECETTSKKRDGVHVLLCEVKPYRTKDEFADHPCLKYHYGEDDEGNRIPADGSAALGVNPTISFFEICHGSGGGEMDLSFFIDGGNEKRTKNLWKEAQDKTRYRKPKEYR